MACSGFKRLLGASWVLINPMITVLISPLKSPKWVISRFFIVATRTHEPSSIAVRDGLETVYFLPEGSLGHMQLDCYHHIPLR